MLRFFKKIVNDIRWIFRRPDMNFGSGKEVNYDTYWQKRRSMDKPELSSWQKQRADIVLPFLKEGSTVIDIGCGDGAVLAYLRDKKGITGIGADINQAVLDQVASQGIDTRQIDISKLETLEALPSADHVTGFEILEHVQNTEEVLARLLAKTKKSILFSVPNTGYYVHRLRLLFGLFPLQWAVHPGEHVRFWTIRDMKSWIPAQGYVLEALIPYEGLTLLNKLWPSLFAQGMIVVIKKKA